MTETLPLPGTKCAGAESSSELIECIDIDDDDDDEGEGGDTSKIYRRPYWARFAGGLRRSSRD